MKRKPIKDKKAYDLWGMLHRYCQGCGISAADAALRDGVGLSRHHLVKFKRSDEPTNLLCFCWREHHLAEMGVLYRGQVKLPTLPLAVCLTLKKLRDPDEFDPARLEELYGQCLPDPEPIPDFLLKEWRSRRKSSV